MELIRDRIHHDSDSQIKSSQARWGQNTAYDEPAVGVGNRKRSESAAAGALGHMDRENDERDQPIVARKGNVPSSQ